MVRMMYRKAKKGVAEQYGVNISKKIIEKIQITDTDREVEVFYDERESYKNEKEIVTQCHYLFL